ncbi:hypothetical protein C2S51_014955 [Perilla frutescens var. frutescens]|nr:hypothetical protein C2S51_014955 [Perilla frutescens var. frutescens]
MAEALLQVLIEKLGSLIQNEIGLILGAEKEMKKLQSTLTTIQSVLEDAEVIQLRNKPIQIWLSKLNDAAFELEDILDECATELSKLERGDIKLKYLKKILSSYKIGRSMKEMARRLDDLASERDKFHLHEIVAPPSSSVDCRREMGSILNEPDHVIGRDEDKENIVDLLVNRVSDCEQLSVIPIIGVGGLGKTTLAQLVFNDQRVSQHFDTKLWVCVSDNFDCKILLEAMIESATGQASGLMQLDALQRRLRDLLNQKRYLLILDDVWNDNQEDWAKLNSILECGSKGASIVVTTRLGNVADIMGTLPFHSLEGLSDEDLWLLFKLRAFGREREIHHNLETIGRQIVKKCGGVPLAAKALGGLLRFKRNENEWIHVRESELWDLGEDIIMPALRLSYHHLPLELRRCFTYCAVFPKDSVMKKRELIFRWMAHGCISSNGVQEVEDIGDKIWNELVVRSIFEQVSGEGMDTTFKMHDLVHDLAHSIMENKVPGTQMKSSSKVREVHFDYYYGEKLSTINDYTRLRILKLNGSSVENLPIATGKSKHLRYLDLSRSEICSLPRTFCRLWNLQILNLSHCSRLKSLPKHIIYMTNLRHIILEGCSALSDMPSGIGKLGNLKTLSMFVVGHGVGNQLDQLELLNLGGRLEIRHLERTKEHMNARKANLVEKYDLRELELHWELGESSATEESGKMMDEKVIEALEPHPNLDTLRIDGFKGSHLPLWIRKMKNLTILSIVDCRNLLHQHPIGDLHHLKSLSLRNLKGLEYIVDQNEIRVGATLFPSLVVLKLQGLWNLKGLVKNEVEGEMMMFQNLRELTINDCSAQSISSFSLRRWFGGLKSLKVLGIYDCKIGRSVLEGWLRHIRSSLEDLEIERCSELDSLPEEITHLHLQCLSLWGLPKLTSLPEWLGNLTSLTRLSINVCPMLTSLPSTIQGMSNLQSLTIYDCQQLTSLPSTIQGMSNLQRLSIWDCPELVKRCEKEKDGEISASNFVRGGDISIGSEAYIHLSFLGESEVGLTHPRYLGACPHAYCPPPTRNRPTTANDDRKQPSPSIQQKNRVAAAPEPETRLSVTPRYLITLLSDYTENRCVHLEMVVIGHTNLMCILEERKKRHYLFFSQNLRDHVDNLSDKPVDNEVEIQGPPRWMAFDREGNPTKVSLIW